MSHSPLSKNARALPSCIELLLLCCLWVSAHFPFSKTTAQHFSITWQGKAHITQKLPVTPRLEKCLSL